jgi:hypothetical protein
MSEIVCYNLSHPEVDRTWIVQSWIWSECQYSIYFRTTSLSSDDNHAMNWVQSCESTYNYPGWWFQPLWKILVSWDYSSQYMET